MYKILLVDDERIIREGIAQSVNWSDLDTELTGIAKDGLEAYEMIRNKLPDIVITDIKMPGLDGIKLIAKVKEEFPETEFIILSGYGEFEFAKQAMAFGIKHYLLKPCNEQKITEVLSKVIKELEQRKARETYVKKIIEDFNKVMPQLKSQFLKEFITNKVFDEEDLAYYSRLFQLDVKNQRVRLLLGQIENTFDFRHLYAFMKISEDLLQDKIILTTTIGEQILILIKNTETDSLLNLMVEIKNAFFAYYDLDVTIAVSEPDRIINTPALFSEVKKYIKYRFYLGEGSIITNNDVNGGDTYMEPTFVYDYEQIGHLVKSGNREEAKLKIDEFFQRLSNIVLDLNLTKTYCLDLFATIIRESPTEKMPKYMKKLIAFEEMETLEQIHRYISDIADELARLNFNRNMQRHNKWIHEMLRLIEDNIDQEELSLKWLANEMLYMNPDYLGKLFKREMKEKFSDYLLRVRMEKAIKLIKETNFRICEIAEKVGFGSNSQYFSQVFKKYTGYTPREYKKLMQTAK